MFEAKIENIKGDILTLTGNETDYQILSITGLNPPNAQINTSSIAGIDGAKFNTSKLETRQIVITLKINGNVENNRQKLYKYFSTKDWCKFYYKNSNRNVYIDCYIQTFECDFFTNSETAQIALLCPQPYFKDIETIITDISKVINCFKFPFSFGSKGATNISVPKNPETDDAIVFSKIEINKITNVFNNCEGEIGVIVEINVYEPINKIELRNTETGEYFTVEYELLKNDKITINTNKMQKSISLLREGITYNLFTSIKRGSTFFQLSTGDNFFSYLVDDETTGNAINIIFKHQDVYIGV